MAGSTLLIERSPGETRAALLSGDTVLQVDHYRDYAPPLAGAVFHARVRRVEPGINAAFVDLDGTREGFLRARAVSGRPKGAAIASLVQEGAALPVRVLDEAQDEADKLPRVATLDAAALAALMGGAPLPVAPCCLDPGPAAVERILAEHAAAADEIVCNDGPLAQAARRWCAENGVAAAAEHANGALFEPAGVEAAIEVALRPDVPLPGGGSLIIEPGATLCAIDVNTGGHLAPAGQAARDVNRVATAAIAHELRLRELSGAIVIDFVRLERAGDRTALLADLRAAVADDPAGCHVLGLSRLGLVEMTRRRRRASLAARLLQPAAPLLSRPDAVACALLRELARRSRLGEGRFAVRAAPAIVALLRGPLAAALAEASAWSRAQVDLVADRTLAADRYAIDTPVPTGRGEAR